jgi:perosamine synthetase
MGSHRFISPYFASIGFRESFILLKSMIFSFFGYGISVRKDLHSLVGSYYSGSACFSYMSARGALASCLSSAGIGVGDEVLLSTYTCLAVPTAVVAIGAKPIYCEIDPFTLNVTTKLIEKAITDSTRAIVIQHTLGSFAPVNEILKIAKSKGILVIEDCALSVGTKMDGHLTGSIADAAIFSMELSKTISVGWGGLLIVKDKMLAYRVEQEYSSVSQLSFLRILQITVQTIVTSICYKPDFFFLGKYIVAVGFKLGVFKVSTPQSENYGKVSEKFIAKLPRPQLKLALHQWRNLDQLSKSYESNGSLIRTYLNNLGYFTPGFFEDTCFSVSPRVSFLVADPKKTLLWFIARGIELGTWFNGPLSPLPNAPEFNYHRTDFPKAVFISDHIVNIPCHNRLSQADISFIEELLIEYSHDHPEDMKIQKKLLSL